MSWIAATDFRARDMALDGCGVTLPGKQLTERLRGGGLFRGSGALAIER